MAVLARCELCFPFADNAPDSVECVLLQRQRGCHACDKAACWRTNLACSYYNRHRERHSDGGLGDNVPHMSQTRIEILKDGTVLQTGRILAPEWWINHSIVIRIEGVDYFMGVASGNGCNCLIDTLRQCLNLICNVAYVRQVLEERHRGRNSQIQYMEYLQLDWHWRDVLELLAQHNLVDRSFDVNDFRVVCVDMNMPGHGDVFGRAEARHTLYIGRQNLNHFVPLFRWHGSTGPMPCRGSKPEPSPFASSSSSQAQSSSSPVVPSAAQATGKSADKSTGSSRCKIAPHSNLLELLNLDPKTHQPLDTLGSTADRPGDEQSESGGEISDDSIEVDGDENSDAEDVFLNIQPSAIADQTLQGQRYLAMRFLEEQLQDDVTMPLQSDFCPMDCDTDLESGISLPP